MTRVVELPQSMALEPGMRAYFKIEDRSIALFNVAGTIYAIDDSCPHAGASLFGGKLDGCTLQCPAHGLKFDLRTGHMKYSADVSVCTYPVQQQNGQRLITLPDAQAEGEKS